MKNRKIEMPVFSLAGKSAIVTGGSKGIGFGVAMRAIDALVAAGVAEESEADGRRVYRVLKAYK